MNITKVSEMPCGTKIQIEDWSGVYGFMSFASTLAAYPVSEMNIKGEFSPKRGRKFRASFNFGDEEETKKAFKDLESGAKELIDFKNHFNNPKNIECL